MSELLSLSEEQIESADEKTLREWHRQLSSLALQRNNQQQAAKVSANSGYGVSGSPAFNYYELWCAEAVTLTGQLVIQIAEKALNDYLRKLFKTDTDFVIYIDTDSTYLNCQLFIDKFNPADPVTFLDQIGESKLQKVLSDAFEEFRQTLNCPKQKIAMKRESIADASLFIAKKNYLVNVLDEEGVRLAKPKLKVKGIEAVRSSTPTICRERIKDAIKIIFNEDEAALIKFIEGFKKEFEKLPVKEIAFPRGLTDYDSWVKEGKPMKGTPIHVKAAWFYNQLLKKHSMNDIVPVREGDKMKFVYMKEPNPIQNNAMGFLDDLPPEFGLHKYIDFDTQFEKSFLGSVKRIVEPLGWATKKQTMKLGGFFGND